MGLLPIFALFITLASAAVWSGTVHRENSGFWFLGKFAFDKDPSGDPTGSIEINLQASAEDLNELQGLEILLYDDESSSWPAVYQKDLTCQEWREKAINWDPSQNDINWQYKVYWDINTTHWYSKPLVGQVTRPRFWWVVLSSCDQNGTADVDYNVHFLNIQRKWWGQEFGTNEMGLNTMYVLFFILYTILAALQILAVVIFRQKQSYVHSLISLFTGVVLLEFLYVFSKLIHYGVYTTDGVGVAFFNDLGDVAEVFARVTFILMIMLLASGWTIVTDKLEEKWIIIVAVVLFFVASTAILIWRLAVQDPRDVDLPYEYRVLSLLLLLVWFLLAVWFLVTTFRNWRREDNPVKKKLYFRLLTIYGLWFVAIPVSVAISMATEPWVRVKVTVSTSLIFSALAYIQMIWLLWPSRAEEYFAVEKPHVPTSLNHYEHL